MDGATPDIWAKLHGWMARAPLGLRGAAGVVAVYLAFYFLIDTHALRHPYLLTPEQNSNVAEAAAILHGRLTLDARAADTALFQGRAYNVYPPMFTLISLAVLPWWPEGIHLHVVLLLALPLPALAYLLFRRRTERVGQAVLLTLLYLFGTSLLPVVNRALARGDMYHVNHLLSQLGLLIFLLDYSGRRRIWLGGLGLVIAAWSRQLTAAYLLPLFYAAWIGPGGARPAPARRGVRVGWVLSLAGVMTALPMTLNTLKFGHPLDSGYRHIYEGCGTRSAEELLRDGMFSWRYLPRNLYYMNLGWPQAHVVNGILRFKPDPYGAGIWWTTPLLLYLWVDLRRCWADREWRVVLLAVAVIVGVLLLYHNTGWAQEGYNRFSLDYLVAVMAVLAPRCDGFRRRVFTPLLTAWSVWSFRWAI